MRCDTTSPGQRDPSFRQNLGQLVPWPYGGWNLEAMDSHGGWIASATDLPTFAAAFNDPDNCPLLTRASIERMHQRPPGLAGHDHDGTEKPRFYSPGCSNRVVAEGKIIRWHTGSLSGTVTTMIRRHDGKNFVALLNTSVSPSSISVDAAIGKLLHAATNQVTDWPAGE